MLSFILCIGGIDPAEAVGDYKEYLIFVFVSSTIFNTIILLNLLIAIISDTFARVAE